MTIQRQYSRPNCKLVLEGPADRDGSTNDGDNPLLSAVTNVECHFAGHDTPLTGGQELLDGLVYTVSRYVQEVLSGITRPEVSNTKSVARVQLQPLGQDLHRLTVNQAAAEADPSKYQVDLKTIQLFDLVETVDQLVADGQTLPSLGVDLSPLPRRYVATQEPVAAKVLPAAIGVSSLAAAAIALFLLPIPEISPPEVDPRPVTEEQVPGLESSSDGPSGVGTGDDPTLEPEEEPDKEPEEEPNEGASNSSPSNNGLAASSNAIPQTQTDTISPTQTENEPPTSEPSQDDEETVSVPLVTENLDSENIDKVDEIVSDNSPTGTKAQPSEQEIDQILGTAQPIADPDQLNELTLQLRDRVDRAWKRPESIDDDLIYRVGVSENGDMVGFKPINDPATKLVDTVPLSQLDTVPVSAAESFQTSIGQFRVVFRTTGVVEVSPWYGRLPE